MKNLTLIFIIVVFALMSCNSSSKEQKEEVVLEESVSVEGQSTVQLHIEGMTCAGCENTIKAGLESIPGVVEVKASHVDSNAIVVYDANLVTVEDMSKVVEKKGYKYIKASQFD